MDHDTNGTLSANGVAIMCQSRLFGLARQLLDLMGSAEVTLSAGDVIIAISRNGRVLPETLCGREITSPARAASALSAC
jgi:hypothetical protein